MATSTLGNHPYVQNILDFCILLATPKIGSDIAKFVCLPKQPITSSL